MNMCADEFELAFLGVEMIWNQELLDLVKPSSFPHVKKDSKEKIHKELYKKAYPEIFREKKALSLDQLSKIIGGGRGR